MKHNRANNSLLVMAVAVFFVTASLYVYMYIAVNNQTMRVVMAKDIQKVQKMDEKQIIELQKVFSHSEPARDKLYSLFIVKDGVVPFIESLEAIGSNTGATVEITSISEVNDETNTKIGKLKAHIEASGSWSQVSKVLILMETMQKSVVIENVRLNTGTTDDGKVKSSGWLLSLNITANILK